jgi:ribonuclease HII
MQPQVRPRSRKPKRTPDERLYDSLFAELARVAEMSAIERRLRDSGFRCIAGTDEVGRGCLAGPVVAACVILPADPTLFGVNDSKLIDHEDRLGVARLVLSRARAVAVGVVEPCTIDRINILRASKLAMVHAVHDLTVRPDVLLLDAVILEDLEMPQIPLIGGDRRSISIAAASVVAKVYRDLLMESYDERYPVYDFKHNRGYATEGHQAALKTYGPSPIHRRSFEGVEEPRLLFGNSEGHGGSTR